MLGLLLFFDIKKLQMQFKKGVVSIVRLYLFNNKILWEGDEKR
jgi:hypothetical protein